MRDDEEQARPLRKDALRNRELILQVAGDLFAELGLDVPYDEIAREAGTGVGTVYRRFPQREDLIVTVFEARVEDLARRGALALEADDPWVGLRAFVEDVVELQVRDRGFSEVLTAGSLYGERVATCGQLLRPRLVALVERAHAAGKLRPDVGVNDFQMLMMMLGWLTDPDKSDVWRRYATLFFAGVTTEPARDPLPLNEPNDRDLQQVVRLLRRRRSAELPA